VDASWTLHYCNKAGEALLGVTAADICGKNRWEEFAGVLPADFYTTYHNIPIQDIPIHFEGYLKKMGTWFEVLSYHAEGTLSISFRHRDHPTGSKRPVHDLKLLNEPYRFATELTNDCLWEWDLRTRQIFRIDGGHKRVYGYPIVNTLIPQSFWESHLHPEDKVRILKGLNKILAEKSNSI